MHCRFLSWHITCAQTTPLFFAANKRLIFSRQKQWSDDNYFLSTKRVSWFVLLVAVAPTGLAYVAIIGFLSSDGNRFSATRLESESASAEDLRARKDFFRVERAFLSSVELN